MHGANQSSRQPSNNLIKSSTTARPEPHLHLDFRNPDDRFRHLQRQLLLQNSLTEIKMFEENRRKMRTSTHPAESSRQRERKAGSGSSGTNSNTNSKSKSKTKSKSSKGSKQDSKNAQDLQVPRLSLPRVELWCRDPSCSFNSNLHGKSSHCDHSDSDSVFLRCDDETTTKSKSNSKAKSCSKNNNNIDNRQMRPRDREIVGQLNPNQNPPSNIINVHNNNANSNINKSQPVNNSYIFGWGHGPGDSSSGDDNNSISNFRSTSLPSKNVLESHQQQQQQMYMNLSHPGYPKKISSSNSNNPNNTNGGSNNNNINGPPPPISRTSLGPISGCSSTTTHGSLLSSRSARTAAALSCVDAQLQISSQTSNSHHSGVVQLASAGPERDIFPKHFPYAPPVIVSESCSCKAQPSQAVHSSSMERKVSEAPCKLDYKNWHNFPHLQPSLKRDASFISCGGFTLNGHPGRSVPKSKVRTFCSSHKIALVVSTFSLMVTIGLAITLLLMKKKGMMEAMK